LLTYENQFIERISTLTATYQTGDLAPTLKIHADLIKKMSIPTKVALTSRGLEEDEFVEMHEKICNVFDAYETFNEEKEEEDWGDDDY